MSTEPPDRLLYPLLGRSAILLVVLLAFGLRAYHLDFQSLWSDEGLTLLRSAQPLDQLLATMPVEQLPGYFVLVHFWLPWAGDHDYALRFFSLWPSVLVVALVYRLAVDLGERAAGVSAALLLATSAFQLWYAQEARTYSWLIASSLWASWSLWRLLYGVASQRWYFTISYTVAMILTVYQHFYAFLVPLAHTVFVLGWLVYRQQWRIFWHWVAAGLITLLCFAPWVARAWQILGFTGWRDPIDPWQIPWRFLTIYTVSESMPAPWQERLPWLYLALLGLGLGVWWRRRPAALLFLLCLTLLPWLAVFGLALRQPDTHERYVLFITAPLLLLAAGGLHLGGLSKPVQVLAYRLARVGLYLAGGLVLVGLVAANWLALTEYYDNSALQKPNYRAVVEHIKRGAQPGDVILVDGPDPRIVLLHYYKGDLPVHDLRDLAEADFDQVDQRLTELTRGAQRAWEVLYFHTPGRVQFWLATRGWTSPPTEYNGIRVTLYGLADQPLVEQSLQVPFGPALLLDRVSRDPGPLPAGQLVRVSTAWQVLAPPPDLKFSLRLHDSQGNLVEAQDYGPQNWFLPTPSWPVGQTVVDQRAFLLRPDLPAGGYRITLRLYDPSNGTALETPQGQDVMLGEIDVE